MDVNERRFYVGNSGRNQNCLLHSPHQWSFTFIYGCCFVEVCSMRSRILGSVGALFIASILFVPGCRPSGSARALADPPPPPSTDMIQQPRVNAPDFPATAQ